MAENVKEKAILTTKDVRLFYGKKEALHGINLDFPETGITALIGPSGSGKSTYLRSINRMHDFTDYVKVTGEFNYNGQNIYDPNTDLTQLRKNIGMVFQQPNPFPFSIYENVAFGLKLDNKLSKIELDERVETALKQAAIWDDVKDRLQQSALGLSGGQQQRIAIARALATRPDILLLDEPTSALDPISSRAVEDGLVEIGDKYSIIIVTHNMQQAKRISDRTAFFMDGNLIEVDSTKNIFLYPKEKETEDYVSGKFG
ncbi:MAG: phosphate ABC transporter ATP-binding protein PstB [Lactobacillaceae bacterium]|jgi:phosphate transport system ATP-binding protein|nr:phosphate ABC transporter ATP-binding protein PstB [Lactobacillaceae bacterium]